MDLCRLARMPDELPGLLPEQLTGPARLYFNLTIARAAAEARMFEAQEVTAAIKEDPFGTVALRALLTLAHARS